MSPVPSPRHQTVLGELHVQLHAALKDTGCRVFLAPFDVRLPDADEPDGQVRTVVQPDLVVICDPAKIDRRGCRGSPDLLVEILSPTTAYKDLTRKLRLFERHGVPEYWIVNPERASVEVHRLGPDGLYGRPTIVLGGESLRSTVVQELSVDLATVFRP